VTGVQTCALPIWGHTSHRITFSIEMEKDITTLLLYDDLPLSFNCQKFTLKDGDDEKAVELCGGLPFPCGLLER